MPYGHEILLRNVKYALRRVDLFHFTESVSFLFHNLRSKLFHINKVDISQIKSRGLKYNDFYFGKSLVSRSGENNAETAAAIPNIVDTPTAIVFI